LEQSLEGLGRIGRIVGSLKEFSHPGGTEKSLAHLNHAIETAVAVSRHEWKYVADVVTELDPGLPGVPCVLDEVNQAILNLIVNAAHAVGEANGRLDRARGRIVVRTRQEPGWVVVEVEDNGTGIPPGSGTGSSSRSSRPRESAKAPARGSPSSATSSPNVHGGRLDFTTEMGRGTTFRLALPLAPEPAVGAGTPGPAA